MASRRLRRRRLRCSQLAALQFPESRSLRAGHLEAYPSLTWTFGLRDTLNSNPLNPHQPSRDSRGSFDSISHDVNQPLSAAIQTGLGKHFRFDAARDLQPRTAIAWQFDPKSVLRAGFGIFSDILPGSVVDVVGVNPPYVKSFQGGLLGTVGGTAIAPGVPNSAVDATIAANRHFHLGFSQGQLSCASLPSQRKQVPRTACRQSRSPRFPAANFTRPTSWSGVSASSARLAPPLASARSTLVRAPSISHTHAGEWLPDRLRGLFCTVSLRAARRSPIRRRHPTFHRREQPLQWPPTHCGEAPQPRIARTSELHLEPLHGHGLEWRLPANFPRAESCRRFQAIWRATTARATTTSATISTRSTPINCQSKVENRLLGYALNGWQVSGTVFWHSGIPFSVMSTPYSANGNGIVNGGGAQFASVVPGGPLYAHNPIPGVTQPGTLQWLNPDAFVSAVDPSTGACVGGDTPANCQFGTLGRNALRGPNFTWSDFYLTKWFPLSERVKLRFDGQFFNLFNHPNFGLPSMVLAGIPGKPATQTGFGALTYTTSPPTGLLGVGLGGDSTPRMIAFQLRLEF